VESIQLTLTHLIEKRNQSKSNNQYPTEENHLPISLPQVESSDMDPAHSTAQIAADPCENEGFGGDPFESMDDPMRNEDLIDNLGGTDSISGDQRENDGMGDETAHDTAKDDNHEDQDAISGDQI
ncbi:hypothetical protein PMAYCL1PPCAC_20786, partial [Pristionchus mayeri]